MATGKYLSLEEARKEGKLKQFCKDHLSKSDETQMTAIGGRDGCTKGLCKFERKLGVAADRRCHENC